MNIRKTWKYFLIILMSCICHTPLHATTGQCSSFFPGPVQTNASTSSQITFHCGGQVLDFNGTSLITPLLTPSSCSPNTCGVANCVASGTFVNPLDVGNFIFATGNTNTNGSTTLGTGGATDYINVNLGNNNTLNFTANNSPSGTLYHISALNVNGNNVTINFIPGDYWIGTFNIAGNGATLNVVGSGTARLYINQSANWQQNNININPNDTTGSKLFIFDYNDITLGGNNVGGNNVVVKGVFYAKNNIILSDNNNLIFTGAMTAKNVTIGNNVDLHYGPSAVTNMDFGSICGGGSTNYFKIIESAQGTFCLPHSITVKAMNGTTQITNYTGAITLSTSSNKGTWSLASGNGTFTDTTSDDGVAQYQFVASDGGQATFNLTYTNGPPVITVGAVQQNNSAVHDDGTHGTITFSPFAFLVTPNQLSNPLTSIPASYSTTQIAGNSNASTNTLYLTAYGLNPNNSVCGIIQSYTGSKSLQFWFNYLDPNSGTLLATINGTNISANASSPTTLPITFTNGQASVLSMYPDVGKIAINLKDAAPAQPIVGATAPFVVKPASFSITVPNSPNPAPVDATGAVFTKAGVPFTAQVRVLNSLGNVTPNYGNECNGTNPCTPEGIILKSAQLIAPSGGRNGSANNGTITNGDSFTRSGSGASTIFTGNNFSFDEVGIIQLTASVKSGNYLGAGNVTTSFGNLGRFIPYDFLVTGNTPTFNAGCVSGNFTYLDQPFSYSTPSIMTVTARAFAGGTTANYTGSFWKLQTASLNPTYTANQTGLIPPTITPVFVDHANGTGDYTFDDINSPGSFKFSRTLGTNTAPFNAEIRLRLTVQDADGVGYGASPYTFDFGAISVGNGIAFNGSKQMLHGRINIDNAFGSELSSLSPLVVPFTVQYYTGPNGFITNTQDSCTVFNNGSNLILQKTPTSLNTTASVSGFSQGVGNLTLTRPNVPGYVDIQVNLSTLPWLQYDWPFDGNQDGQYDDNPQSRATFGIFKGTDQIIYEREVYQ